jgi:hypothetical protein
MVELIVPLLFGLLALLSALSRFKRDRFGSGMVFLVGGLVLLMHCGLSVSGAAANGIQGLVSSPSSCARPGVRC